MKNSRKIIVGLTGITMGMAALPAAAQSADRFEQQDRREVHLGVTIPFGSTGKTTAEKPQLQLGVRSYGQRSGFTMDQYNWALRSSADKGFYEHKLGLTLSESPSLMLNGQEMQFGEDEKLGLNTTQTVLIGAAAIVILAVAINYVDDCVGNGDDFIELC